jgi:hypothetical protein
LAKLAAGLGGENIQSGLNIVIIVKCNGMGRPGVLEFGLIFH